MTSRRLQKLLSFQYHEIGQMGLARTEVPKMWQEIGLMGEGRCTDERVRKYEGETRSMKSDGD